MTIKAIYPGTFDPITYGHLDIIQRALNIVDHLVVSVAIDTSKNVTFSAEERLKIVENEIKNIDLKGKKVEVCTFSGLLVSFAENTKANFLVRGLRAISDFEYEFQMSCVNSRLAPNIETMFLPASESTHFISSRLVKEVARLGGDVSKLVPNNVQIQLKEKFNKS